MQVYLIKPNFVKFTIFFKLIYGYFYNIMVISLYSLYLKMFINKVKITKGDYI